MPRTWRRLTETLQSSNEDVVEMSFTEVSSLVGDVPTSELEDPALWSNTSGKAHAKAWLDAGYRVKEVDETQKVVRFKRT